MVKSSSESSVLSLPGFVKCLPESSSSYPCRKEVKRSHDILSPLDLDLILKKHTCGSPWCPSCFKNRGKDRVNKRLVVFDWERTRHVMLSIDRDQFNTGEEAFKYVSEKKLIPNMIWNLQRIQGIDVQDWMWIVEFHKDGFPHWHLFIEVGEKGSCGMIGGNLLRQYWPWGRWVHESRIFDKQHWRNLLGYFDKHGYFGKPKEYQNSLPQWAVKWDRIIKRYGAKILPSVDQDKKIKNVGLGLCARSPRRSYLLILSDCGAKTRVQVTNWQLSIDRMVDVPYLALRGALKGCYVVGVGYLVQIDQGDLFLLGEKFNGLWGLIYEILEKEKTFYDYIWDGNGVAK